MRPIVHAVQVVPAQGAISVYYHAGAFHAVEQRFVHLDAARPVNHDIYSDARSCAFRKCVGDLRANLARPVDVGFEVNGLLSLADRIEKGWKYLNAVFEDGDTISRHYIWPEHYRHFVAKLIVLDSGGVLDAGRYLLFGCPEVGGYHHHGCTHQKGDKRNSCCALFVPSYHDAATQKVGERLAWCCILVLLVE